MLHNNEQEACNSYTCHYLKYGWASQDIKQCIAGTMPHLWAEIVIYIHNNFPNNLDV
jgi:hypothetical protein